MQYVDVVVGGQYGSEAKGHVTAQLLKSGITDAEQGEVPDFELWNVRVAGPNAGHTVYDTAGRKYAFRQLPVGAVVNPNIKLYLAPGSEIDIAVLRSEIAQASEGGHNVAGRLYISRQATVITNGHKVTEAETELTARVGSTAKGIGAARADRIMRTAQTMGDMYTGANEKGLLWRWAEPEDLYATDELVHHKNQRVVIEGTQGYGLSLRASGHYPQVTSSDCRSIDFLAMAGIDPTRCNVIVQNWVVCRVFPIRVAGNSGPMKEETSWNDLGLEAEQTTVTGKTRRVGGWDPELVARAVQANGGHEARVVITMMDQVIPELKDLAQAMSNNKEEVDLGEWKVLDQVRDWVMENASVEQIGAEVAAFTFSPTNILWVPSATDNVELPEEALQGIIKDIINGTIK